MKYPRVLDQMEVAQMFRKAQLKGIERDEMLLKCLYYIGLKSSEVQHLRVGDLDVNDNSIVIRGKTGRNERDLVIPGRFPFELAKFTKGKRPEELVFHGRGPDGIMSNRHIRRLVKDYARMAEVRNYEEIKPHTLRISYASHLRKDGVPVKSIQALLGHARRETTYIYTHGLSRIEPKRTEDGTETAESREPGAGSGSKGSNP